MKIGFDAKRYYHNQTGLGNYSRTLVSGLQRLYPDNDYILYDEGAFSRTFRLLGKAAADGCDIFHGLSNEIPMALTVGNSTALPYTIVTMHDIAWLTFPEMYKPIDRKIYDWKYGRSCQKADKVIAISESTKRDVMRFYGVPESRIEVIYQPVQQYYYEPLEATEADRLIDDHFHGTLPKDSYILYVGSINSRKNLLAAVKALALLPAERRPLLLIIGNGHEYRRRVEEYIHTEHLESYTRIETGIHNNRLLQALYQRARAFVYPSFYEGFGLPVVEAALQQTPVITTTVSSLPEAAGPDACLIDPHDKDSAALIAHHLDRLLCDDALRRSVGQQMEAYARRMFTPDTLTKQIMELYAICQK